MSETPMDPEFVRLVGEIEEYARALVSDPYNGANLQSVYLHTRAALWRRHCERVESAFREGYETGSDPAWCEKQLRRAGIKVEAHKAAATDHFWRTSEARARIGANDV